jgi:hypothetical protein
VVKVNARAHGCAAHKDRGPAVCGGVVANHAEPDRVVLDRMRGALTAPDVLAWIEQEALRRANELTRDSAEVDAADRSREQRVQREIEKLTDAVVQMGLYTALAERLRKAEAERDALQRARTRASVAPLPSATTNSATRRETRQTSESPLPLRAALSAAWRSDVSWMPWSLPTHGPKEPESMPRAIPPQRRCP